VALGIYLSQPIKIKKFRKKQNKRKWLDKMKYRAVNTLSLPRGRIDRVKSFSTPGRQAIIKLGGRFLDCQLHEDG
jgi:hypothetical protein